MRRISQVFLVIALLLSSAAISPGVAVQGKASEGQPVSQTTPDPAGNKVYMPVIRVDPSYTVTGQVTDSLGKPVANVKVVNQDGRSAYTDASGKYNLSGLPAGSNGLAPAKDGMVFPSTANMYSVRSTPWATRIAGRRSSFWASIRVLLGPTRANYDL